MRKLFLTLTLLLPLPVSVQADENTDSMPENNGGFWQSFKYNVSETWKSSTWDLYIPVNTWHNRWLYDREKIDSYNERPWGVGIGRSRFDEDGNWHALYAMEFQDSHNQFQPIAGYGYQRIWYPDAAKNWRLGFGYTAAITARHEYSYIPIPIILPMFAIEYKRFAVQNVYIPGLRNDGNVLFTWVRWQF